MDYSLLVKKVPDRDNKIQRKKMREREREKMREIERENEIERERK